MIDLQYHRGPTAPDRGDHIIGVIGFGGDRPSWLATGIPFARSALRPLPQPLCYEVWRADGPVRTGSQDGVAFAATEAYLFALLDAPADTDVQTVTQTMYQRLQRCLQTEGYPHPWRWWNTLPRITGQDAGGERYHAFNAGRHAAFRGAAMATLPAASGVGGQDGPLLIGCLAARRPGIALENPAQISAYRYPPRYGPHSPLFSRAMLTGDALFISGTAAITGHASRHPGNLAAQADATIANLHILLQEAARHGAAPAQNRAMWKIYLRHADDLATVTDRVRTAFPHAPKPLTLQAEICRDELLVEIEGFLPAANLK